MESASAPDLTNVMSADVVVNTVNAAVNNLANNDNLSNSGDSGGMSRWLLWTIIVSAVAIVVTGAVFLVRYIIRRNRESNSIISDVAETVSDNVDKKAAGVVVDAALKSAATSAQLEANVQTASQLYAKGGATQDEVKRAIVAAELSKADTNQKNLEAAKALEDLRKKELASADEAILKATQNASAASEQYGKLSDSIVSENIKKAQDALAAVKAKREDADAAFKKATEMRIQAEKNAKDRLVKSATAKQAAVKAAQDTLAALNAKINSAKTTFQEYMKTQTQDAGAPKQPKPVPSPSPSPSPVPSPAPSPVPSPAPSAGSVLIMGETITSNLNNKTIAGGKKAWGKSWPVPSQFKNGAKLSFEINFAPGFSFDDGPTDARGKVGGLHIGSGAASGCSHSDTGGSLRLMWEHQRSGQAYTYFPTSTKGKQPAFITAMGDPNCGLGIWKKDFNQIFSATGSWYTVTLGILMNDVGKNNGKLYMSVAGPKSLTRESDGIIWRVRNGMDISEINFNSFFGGDNNMTRVKPSSFQLRNVRIGPY
jgi:hypothetical protein